MQDVKVPSEHQVQFAAYLTKQGIPHTVTVNGSTTTFKSQQSLKMFWHTFKKTRHIRQGEHNGRQVLLDS